VIELHQVHVRVPPLVLPPLTLTMASGAHALFGGRLDGPSVVLAMLAGQQRPKSGAVLVARGHPEDPAVRREVAYVPLDAALPEPMRVDEVMRMASQLRGEQEKDAGSRLDVLGLAPLERRTVRSLSFEERRAVLLAEAVTSEASVLLVEEPLAHLDARATALAGEALRARAARGACVVVATASLRDARLLAEDVLTFDRGVLVRRAAASDPVVLSGPRGASVRVIASDAARLAAELAHESPVARASVVAGVLVAQGADAVEVAAAIARAAARADVAIESLTPDLLHDAELRATLARAATPPTPLATPVEVPT
jgi:ABC-type multidrug transport system ATPase subunit